MSRRMAWSGLLNSMACGGHRSEGGRWEGGGRIGGRNRIRPQDAFNRPIVFFKKLLVSVRQQPWVNTWALQTG